MGSQNSLIQDLGLTCKNSSLALLQDLERCGADLFGWVPLRGRKVGLWELTSINGTGKEKGDKQFLVWTVLMQFIINLAPKKALPAAEV